MNLYNTEDEVSEYCRCLRESVFGSNNYVKSIDKMISMIDCNYEIIGIENYSLTIILFRNRLQFFKNVCIPLIKFIEYVYYNRIQFLTENVLVQYAPTPYDTDSLFDFLRTLNPVASDYLLCMLSDQDSVKLKLRIAFHDNDKDSFSSLLMEKECNLTEVSTYLKKRDIFSIMSCDSFELLSIFNDRLLPISIYSNETQSTEPIKSNIDRKKEYRKYCYLDGIFGLDDDKIEKHFLNYQNVTLAYKYHKDIIENWITDYGLWDQEEYIFQEIVKKQNFDEINDVDKIYQQIRVEKDNTHRQWIPENFFYSSNDCKTKDEFFQGLKGFVLKWAKINEGSVVILSPTRARQFERFIDALASNNYFEDNPATKLYVAQIFTGKRGCFVNGLHWNKRVCDLYFLVKYMFDGRPDFNKADRLFNITDEDRKTRTETDVKKKSAAADRPTPEMVSIVKKYFPEIIIDYDKKHPKRKL